MTIVSESGTGAPVVLRIDGLRIAARTDHGVTEVVQDVSLTVRRGEVLGLIGESGAGKSTIGLASMGYVRNGLAITGGSIEFNGRDLIAASEEEKRRLRGTQIAYVAQSAAASFNPAHRLIDQHCESSIEHGLAPKSQVKREAIELYRRLRLPEPETIGFRYPHQVSGGQLQRAMTAMATATRPELIIFDEPTTALDVTTQIEVLAAMRDAVRQFGTAAIYISHDLAVVAQMADRIMVLRHGRMVEEAETQTMMSEPTEDYTKALWATRRVAAEPRRPLRAQAEPVVKVRGISASYGTVPVLEDVSIEVHANRTLAVVGESGSGKSTLARVITGLLPPTSGEISFLGETLSGHFRQRSRDQLRRIQMIHQMPDTALNPRQKVRDVIGRPLEFYHGLKGKAREAEIRSLLEEIELDPDTFIDRRPGELSGGQKQRVCIARALAAKPDLLICDEVTSALDQLVAEGVLKQLRRLQDDYGLACIFITHDLATVEAIADDVAVMNRGKIVEQGSRAEVFAPPHDPYTELLLSSVPQMDPDWLTKVLAHRHAGE